MTGSGRRNGLALGVLIVLAAPGGFTGCGNDCCTSDSMPIPVTRAPRGDGMPGGALLALARLPAAAAGDTFRMVIDTATPVTILAGTVSGNKITPAGRDFDLLDATAPAAPVRARFRGIGTFTLPLGPTGDAATMPGGVLGGDLLSAFSVELRFAAACPGAPAGTAATCSAVTFWGHQGASSGFLGDAGYAVLRFTLFGGGETTAQTAPDALGLRGPIDVPPTRIVQRACAVPRAFVPTEQREQCCTRGTEITLATGTNLSLVLATGAGPMVLSRSAWMRILAQHPEAAAPTLTPPPDLLLATWPTPIKAEWHTIPRFALIDGGEPPSTGDEGPCVDLARSRRIEWAAIQQQAAQQTGAPEADCVQVCDTDPREPSLAQNSAAYLELGGAIPVAVIEDAEPLLQSLRFDIRPEGPEVDGLLGAGALGSSRLEIDYKGDPPRAIFSCEQGVARDVCYAAARCPRLPDNQQSHLCFGLPSHHLPAVCAASGCGM